MNTRVSVRVKDSVIQLLDDVTLFHSRVLTLVTKPCFGGWKQHSKVITNSHASIRDRFARVMVARGNLTEEEVGNKVKICKLLTVIAKALI